jgi:hypothetical protein
MKAFFIISIIFLFSIVSKDTWAISVDDSKQLLVDQIKKLSQCFDGGTSPCCKITKDQIGDIGPNFHYKHKTKQVECSYLKKREGRRQLITSLIKSPPGNSTEHYQNIFCGDKKNSKLKTFPISDNNQREKFGKKVKGGCKGRFRLGCGKDNATKPQNLKHTYCSGNFTRIFGKAGEGGGGKPIPPEKTLEFLRSINPDVPQTIEDFEGDRNYETEYNIPEKVEEEEGGDEDVPGDEAKKCTLSPQDGSTITLETQVEHSKNYKLECKSETHVGGGEYTCKNGTLEKSDGFKDCTKKTSTDSTPGEEAAVEEAAEEVVVDPVAPVPTEEAPPADSAHTDHTTSSSRTTTSPRTTSTESTRTGGSETSSFAPVPKDKNPCVQAAKQRAAAAAEATRPQLPTKQTCEKANRAFAKALEQMGDVEVGGKKFKELQQKRDELKRRKALYDDMEHLKTSFNDTLKGIIDLSPDNPEKMLQAIESSSAIREFQGLSYALDEILKENATTDFLFGKKNPFSKKVKDSCNGENANKEICEIIDDKNVALLINNFGSTFNSAFQCEKLEKKKKKKCKKEVKKALTDFSASMSQDLEKITKLRLIAEQKRKIIENPGDSTDSWGTSGQGPRLSMARLSKNLVLNSLPSMYGLDPNTGNLKTESLEQFFGKDGTLNDPEEDSFLEWVKKSCAQRARKRYANGENYQKIHDSYKNNPEKAMTDFLNDITKELSGLCNQDVKPGKKCPKDKKFCQNLSDCLTKLNNKQEVSPITKAKAKIKADLDKVNKDLEKFKANPEFNNKKVFAQNLADYVSFCDDKNLYKNEIGKKHQLCKSGEDTEDSSLELLLDVSGKIITQIDPLIQMRRKIPSDQLYVLNGSLADSCRMTRHGEMEGSSSEAGEICAEASSFVDRANESSCQGQRLAAHIRKGKGDCAYWRSRNYFCHVLDDGTVSKRMGSPEGVGSWGEFFTESLSQITSSINVWGATMFGFKANLMGHQAEEIAESPFPDALAFAQLQRTCGEYASANYSENLFAACAQVITQNPIMAQQAGMGPVANSAQGYGGVILGQLGGPQPPCANAPPPMFQSLVGIPGDGSTSAQCVPLSSAGLPGAGGSQVFQ